MANNRDDFSKSTRNTLALRANYRCSFPDCRIATSGPSDESPNSVVTIGVAAHICAASPGGPRYLESMTREERVDITNGIWLCPTHSTLIDRDSVTYTVDALHAIKVKHERMVIAELLGINKSLTNADLVAIGPEFVFTGELISFDGDVWQFLINHIFIGEITSLITFGENFEKFDISERYVLVNSLGDGRQLKSAPTWQKSNSGFVVSCKVHGGFTRTSAHNLPQDFAVNDAYNIYAEHGSFAVVSGVNALPQRIRSCLSMQRGESPFYPTLGARITEYFEKFRDSCFLARLLKLEVIRHACVPYFDPVTKDLYTPLGSVLLVRDVVMLPERRQNESWFPFRFNLDVEGIGNWQCDILIFIPKLNLTKGGASEEPSKMTN